MSTESMKETRKAAKPIWQMLGADAEAPYRQMSQNWLAQRQSGVNAWHNARSNPNSRSKKTKTAYALFLDDFKDMYRTKHPGTDIKVIRKVAKAAFAKLSPEQQELYRDRAVVEAAKDPQPQPVERSIDDAEMDDSSDVSDAERVQTAEDRGDDSPTGASGIRGHANGDEEWLQRKPDAEQGSSKRARTMEGEPADASCSEPLVSGAGRQLKVLGWSLRERKAFQKFLIPNPLHVPP